MLNLFLLGKTSFQQRDVTAFQEKPLQKRDLLKKMTPYSFRKLLVSYEIIAQPAELISTYCIVFALMQLASFLLFLFNQLLIYP